MHCVYENKYKYNESMCRKAAMDVYYRRPFALVLHVIAALVCILGFASIFYYLAGGVNPPYHYSTYFFYALAPIASEIAVYIKFRLMLKKEMELICDDGEMTVRVENDTITEYIGGEKKGESSFINIDKIYESHDFFLVIALSQEYFILKKGCFTEGEESEFKNEIKQRAKEIYKAAIEKGKKKKK